MYVLDITAIRAATGLSWKGADALARECGQIQISQRRRVVPLARLTEHFRAQPGADPDAVEAIVAGLERHARWLGAAA